MEECREEAISQVAKDCSQPIQKLQATSTLQQNKERESAVATHRVQLNSNHINQWVKDEF